MFDWMITLSLRKSKETFTFAKIYKIYDYAYVKKKPDYIQYKPLHKNSFNVILK